MFDVKYIDDNNVTNDFDLKIRNLLSLCFENEPKFRTQRYCYEMPRHRWYIENNEILIAHTALHEKSVSINGNSFKVGGIAEVCIHPDFRGRGFVRALLSNAHVWLKLHDFEFSLLLANHPNVYSSSGYFVIENDIKYYEPGAKEFHIERFPYAMVARIGDISWPEGLLDFNGPKF